LAVKFPTDISDKKLHLKTDAAYLNFNYTNTLEHFYGIPRSNIVYIHGDAQQPDSQLILGHGKNPQDFKPKEPQPPTGLSDEELMEWQAQMSDDYDFSFLAAQDEILGYFGRSHKNTSAIIGEQKAYFNSLADVESITVLGHSLSPVDQPYVKKILEATGYKADWHVSYYRDEEKDFHKTCLTSLGLPEAKIHFFKMPELMR